MLQAADLTLGILAGGRASRLGGRDKAWLVRDGRAQVERHAADHADVAAEVLVSANGDPSRYASVGLRALADRVPGIGPMGGLDALAAACNTPWLITVPVDAIALPRDLLPRLAVAGAHGAVAEDADGLQPLVALYRVAPLREALARAIASGEFSVRALQAGMALPVVAMRELRFGNLNTPEDLLRAGVDDA